MSIIEKYAPFNWGQFHVYIDGRDISLSPSSNKSILYLTVKIPNKSDTVASYSGWSDDRRNQILDNCNGADLVYPRECEKAFSVWYAKTIGAEHVVIRAPSNSGIDLSGSNTSTTS